MANFDIAVERIGNIATELGIFPNSHFVLITNGSLIHREQVQVGLKMLQHFGGEIWFKLDSATQQGRSLINNSKQTNESVLKNLTLASQLCETKIQIALMDYQNQGLLESERIGFLEFLEQVRATTSIQFVTIYTLARPSNQPEAVNLKAMSFEIMDNFAEKIRQLGFHVIVTK